MLILEEYTRALYEKGNADRRQAGDFILVDTKYEFGKIGDTIYLIDEVHTPDSSRYFYKDTYNELTGCRPTTKAAFKRICASMANIRRVPGKRWTANSRNDR